MTISGNNSDRIFQINANTNVAIRRLKITSGLGRLAGGCLDSRGGTNTTLEDVIVFNCRVFVTDPIFTIGGGTIVNGGTMNIVRSSIQSGVVNRSQGVTNAFGGGIYNLTGATLRLISSSVTNNTITGGSGGGIRNHGQLIMINSTVSGNEATDAQNGNGGGISNTGVVNILHSTIAYNRASTGGGGVFTSEANNMFNSRNSIYSDNTVGANEQDFNGTLISGGYNLLKNTTDTTITGDTTGNILNINPLLQPISNAGGISYYHLLSQASPAIDKGKTFDIFNDQRSLFRAFDDPDVKNAPGGDGADIGAIEMQITKFSNTTMFDFDGDSRADLSTFRPASNEWWINRSSTNVTTSTPFGTSTDKLVPADYTGDGKTDLTYYRPSNGTWFSLRSEDSTLTSIQFGISEDFPTPGDFDSDGRADFAVYRPSQGTWYIRQSSNGNIISHEFGIAEDQPIVADYDGDGKSDIAIYRPSVSEWWIVKSNGSGVFAVQFGQTGDRTVQGDYTGDGRADIAIWRPSNGFWYILRSEDSSYYAFPFGQLGDLPVPADYDGDGTYDVGVFRPTDMVWYLLRSTEGFSSKQFGISGDQPIPNVFVRQ